MNVEIDIVGGADENEAAAILAAIQALIAEEEEAVRKATAPSRWKSAPRSFARDPWKLASPNTSSDDTRGD